jgi:hypothetical protein
MALHPRRCQTFDVATRSTEERKADALAKLTAVNANVWVASASPSGAVYLVPVSHTWNGTEVVVATGPSSRTVANITANPKVRLALGETRDVVMIDAVLVNVVPIPHAPAALADGYAAQAGWDPRSDEGDYVYLVLGPERIQVSREGEELTGRTVMRNGAWVV